MIHVFENVTKPHSNVSVAGDLEVSDLRAPRKAVGGTPEPS